MYDGPAAGRHIDARSAVGIVGPGGGGAAEAALDLPEQAGEFVRALGEITPLNTRERHEIFREVVNLPGEAGRSIMDRISTEDPWAEIREATENLGPTNYKRAERDAKRVLEENSDDS